eukprot:scaffold172743_cov70-Cyclotella_meneghiniana.AAC.1
MADLPEEIIKEYRLRKIVNTKGFVFVEVTKGMYGLPQAGLLANELLEKRLNKEGYFQSKLVAGLWSHKTRPIQFTLVVDDFGSQQIGQAIDTLAYTSYGTTINVKYTYECPAMSRMHSHNSITNHKLRKRQHQPFPHTPIEYGVKQQFAKESSKSPKLDAK